jgi:hypothetical protein
MSPFSNFSRATLREKFAARAADAQLNPYPAAAK